MAQKELERAGIDITKLRRSLRSFPELLSCSIEELAEELGELHGVAAAEHLANWLLEEVARVSPA